MKTYPLLQSQLGVFTEWMADPSITRYNLPAVVRFSKKVIPEKIIKALETIIAKRFAPVLSLMTKDYPCSTPTRIW